MARVGVLFVCLGNICRSPIAEAVFKDYVERLGRGHEFKVDSAGTSGWHDGKLPDAASMRVAKERGLDISYQRSRKLRFEDFEGFEVLVGMDASNLKNMAKIRAPETGQLVLLRAFDSEGIGEDVPDPWQQPDAAFHEVYDMVERCMPALLAYIDARRAARV